MGGYIESEESGLEDRVGGVGARSAEQRGRVTGFMGIGVYRLVQVTCRLARRASGGGRAL